MNDGSNNLREEIILGIDPGLARTGYGLVKKKDTKYAVVDYGFIATEPNEKYPHRLDFIYQQIGNLIKKYQPQILAVEELFFNKNIKSAMAVSQAKGVVLLAGRHHNLVIKEYTPLEIKMAVTGYGKADKMQVQKMVQVLLNLKDLPQPDHAADALAAALCCIHQL